MTESETVPPPGSEPPKPTSGLGGIASGYRQAQLVCGGGGTSPEYPPGSGRHDLPGDLNDTHNNGVFQQMRILRTRGFAGLQFQWEILSITGEFAMDVIDPGFFSSPPDGAGRPRTGMGATGRDNITLEQFTQWTTSISVGFAFR